MRLKTYTHARQVYITRRTVPEPSFGIRHTKWLGTRSFRMMPEVLCPRVTK